MLQTLSLPPAIRAPMVTIRTAKQRDLPALRELISELAAHHGDAAAVTPENLERDLFGRMPWITALVAEAAGELIGYAILVPLYRAQQGARGMELHHLYVRSAHRGTGIGRHLVAKAPRAGTHGRRHLSLRQRRHRQFPGAPLLRIGKLHPRPGYRHALSADAGLRAGGQHDGNGRVRGDAPWPPKNTKDACLARVIRYNPSSSPLL